MFVNFFLNLCWRNSSSERCARLLVYEKTGVFRCNRQISTFVTNSLSLTCPYMSKKIAVCLVYVVTGVYCASGWPFIK